MSRSRDYSVVISGVSGGKIHGLSSNNLEWPNDLLLAVDRMLWWMIR